MKRNLPILSTMIFSFILMFFIAVYAWGAGSLDVGYIYDSDGQETYQVRLGGEQEEEKTGFIYSFELYKQQQKEELQSLDVDSTIQLDLYFNPYFAFAAIDYERSIVSGIEDKIDTGIGGGWKNDYFKGQSGIYISSENNVTEYERNIINQTMCDTWYPVNDELSLESEGVFEMDLKNTDDYIFTVSAGPKIKISEKMTAGLTYEHQYINEPKIGPTDHRKFMFEVGRAF